MTWYQKAAHRGNGVYSAAAQFDLGGLYRTGNGVPKNPTAAVTWYRRAADNGNLKAWFALGEMYAQGEGVSRNAEAAVSWFRLDQTFEQAVNLPLNVGPWLEFQRKKADNGDVRAQFTLGWLYHHGKGVIENAETAAGWYRKAANRGDARAQFNLGVMHTLREGTPRDLVVAHMWFSMAAACTDPYQMALFSSKLMLHKNPPAAMRAIEGDMTPSEIAEAIRRAQAWTARTS